MKVLTKLAEMGFTVSLPIGENAPYDLIFDNGSKLHKVQCKNGTLKNGSIVAKLQSVSYSGEAGKAVAKNFDNTKIDYLGIYCAENDSVYLVPAIEIGGTQCNLRIEEVSHPTTRNRWAKDYAI